MKKKIIFKTLLFGLLFLVMAAGLTLFLQRKSSLQKYTPFYESKENFDVLFFGTSHGVNGFAPMELWDANGIASYNLSQHSEYMPVTYWQVVNALEHTDPKLVVIDPYLISAPDKIPSDHTFWSYVHDSLDAMPLSSTKIQAVWDLLPTFNDRFEFLWNFVMYHNRWNELNVTDYQPTMNIEKGAESRIGNMRLSALSLIESSQYTDLSECIGLSYLDKIVDLCHEKGVEVLLVYLPYQADAASQMVANGIDVYAKEKGVDYLNLLPKNLINYSTDMYDHGHLNPSGYKKVSEYLGNYITTNYDIPDRRNDADYYKWFSDYEIYADMQIQALQEASDFYVYLTLLNNKNLSYTISINGASSFLANSYVAPYFYNLGITLDLDIVSDSKDNYFAIVDNAEGTISEFVGEDHIEAYPSFGEVIYDCDENGIQTFNIATTTYDGTQDQNYIYITVINNRTGQVVDNITYYENVHYEYFRDEE